MQWCVVAGAKTYSEMLEQLGYEYEYKIPPVHLNLPITVAEYIDRYGWPYLDAKYKLGEVLVSSGVYDKLDAYYSYFYDYK
jgi:hypothetical protein